MNSNQIEEIVSATTKLRLKPNKNTYSQNRASINKMKMEAESERREKSITERFTRHLMAYKERQAELNTNTYQRMSE